MAAGGINLASPPRRMALDGRVVVISSSPEFPSVCDLFPRATKKPALRSGSNAAPIPDDVPTTFTSAASILQSSRVPQAEELKPLDTSQPRTAVSAKQVAPPAIESSPVSPAEPTSAKLKQAKRKPNGVGGLRRSTAMNRPGLHDGQEEPVTETLPAATPVPNISRRKPRSTKDPAAGQSTLPRAKVTKPAAKEGSSKRKKTETVSKHFAPPAPVPEPIPELAADPIEDEWVIRQPAMRRRLDWTPPRESVLAPQPVESPVAEEGICGSAEPIRRDIFGTLQDTYGRNAGDDCVLIDDASVLVGADVLGKRKLIEMVAPNGAHNIKTPETSPTKPKAAKKKARTITELATAAYRLPEDCDSSLERPKRDSLLGHLETKGEKEAQPEKDPGVKRKISSRPAKPKPKPKAGKTKREEQKQRLLSPTSAMRQVAKQDFVFGTASQLAIEDDPELLRALHEAMKLSNQTDSDPFSISSRPTADFALRKKQGGSLWAAGARDEEGDLIDLPVLDLTGSSPLANDLLLLGASNPPSRAVAKASQSRGTVCIAIDTSDDTLDHSVSPSVTYPRQSLPSAVCPLDQTRSQLDNSNSSSHHRDARPTAVNEPDPGPPPSNQEQHQLLLSQPNSPRQQQREVASRPNFELYSDARLAREVASFGFKVVKKRAAMIALLCRCWESQNRFGMGTKTSQAAMATSSAKPTTSPSRPRKTSTTSGSNIDIPQAPARLARKGSVPRSDSEAEPVQPAKPPRGRPKKDVKASPTKRSAIKGSASPKRVRPPTDPAAAAPATPRRRKAPAPAVVEVPDSESDDPFASTPSSSPDKAEDDDVFSSPAAAMDVSVTEDTETSLVASPTGRQVALFGYITQAVVSAPRATDPAKPSWHEKMLMYDPIILEDLTAWLNAGQLDRVGYDGEVSPGDVKKWCESKSVCCLWRVNLHGKERKRF